MTKRRKRKAKRPRRDQPGPAKPSALRRAFEWVCTTLIARLALEVLLGLQQELGRMIDWL